MKFLSDIAGADVSDLLALAILVATWLALGWVIENPPAGRPSVSFLMQGYRYDWMRQFVSRQPRIFDATIVDSLRQGTSFLASACLIAIGGGIALIGNTDKLSQLTADLSLDESPAVLVELKVLVVTLFITNAMLKFVWAHRLFGYCAIVMAAVPNDPDDPRALGLAMQAAEVNIHAARNFNRGLRSVYFALAGLGWLVGPAGLLLATLATAVVTARREFASHSRRALLAPPR